MKPARRLRPVIVLVVLVVVSVAPLRGQEVSAEGVAVLVFEPCGYADCRSTAAPEFLPGPSSPRDPGGFLGSAAPQVGFFAQAVFPAPLPCNPVTNSYALITGPRVPCPVLGAAGCAGFCAIDPTCVTATWAAYSSWFPPPTGMCFETCYCLPY